MKDVVSVPTDYDCQKMRVCKYTVLNINERVELDISLTDEDGVPLESDKWDNNFDFETFTQWVADACDPYASENGFDSVRL